jgi:glycerophosphoryl diester phosphodiesterase
MTTPLLVALGGAAADAPEHTIPAYETAIRQGADALGLELRLSADDQLVVIRDSRLERTTDGRGRVRDHTLPALKRLDAGRWFGRAHRGQRVQTLSEVLERFRDRTAFHIVLPLGSDFAPGIEERLVTLLQIYDALERTLLLSPDLRALAKCRDLDPDLRLAAQVGARLLEPGALAPTLRLEALALPADLTSARDVAACRAAGLACHVGPVDDPLEARQLVDWGVAGVVTAHPGLLRPVLRPPG